MVSIRWPRGALVAALALAAVSVAAGCGSGSQSSASSTASPATTSSTTGGSAAARSSGVTIEVWDWGSPAPAAFKPIDQAYMKAHPGVTIKRVHQPFNSYFTLMRTAVASRKGPDIFENYASPFIFDYYRGLSDLSKYRTTQQKNDLIGWQYVSAGLKPDGTPYAMPWTGQGINFYYNKALFKKAGLNPNRPPRTWSQLLADCAKLKKAGIVPIVAGFKDGYYAEWWADVLSAQYMTPQQLTQSYSKPQWASQPIEKALGLLLDLVHKGYVTPHAEAVPLFPDTVNNFGSGKGAIFLGLSANNANYSEFSKDKVAKNLGAFVAPLAPGSKWKAQKFDFGPGLSWIVAKWSKHPTEAYAYLSYLAQPATQEKMFQLAGSFPNNTKAKPKAQSPLARELLGWVTKYPVFVGQVTEIRSNVEAEFDKAIPGIVTGRQSIHDAMQQVQTAQEKSPPIPTH